MFQSFIVSKVAQFAKFEIGCKCTAFFWNVQDNSLKIRRRLLNH